ncbi:MAG: ABC transporter permease [Acidobacteria bacterium]|nr:ABC transporter permease [Acidobacteriota bacterium]
MTTDPTDIDAEVQFHIDEAVDRMVRDGWTIEAARLEAERRFGNSTRYRRELSAMANTESRKHHVRQLFSVDWKDAFRALRSAPVVTIAAVLSLALGIGANTALFSIVNGLLLKPLPVHEPDRLALVADGDWTNPIWEQIRDQHSQHFAGAAAWSNTVFDLAESGERERTDGAYVSGGFFDTLGVRAHVGRTLRTTDDRRGGGVDGPVAVISHTLWQRRFNGASDVVGKRLIVNRLPFTIVGVMPQGFFGAEVGRSAEVYLPIVAESVLSGAESGLDNRSMWWLEIFVRLPEGQTLDDASRALNQARPAIREATMPDGWPADLLKGYLGEDFALVDARTGQSALRSRFADPLIIVSVIVAGVLLIACANVANLMLARATARRQEMSVRLALGASRGRVLRQLLAEALLLSVIGSALGLVIAQWGGDLLIAQLGSSVSRVSLDLSMDWRVLGLTSGIAMITTLLFGLVPAMGLSGVTPNDALRDAGRGSVGDRRVNIRSALVVVQVALSLVLIIGAALFVRTFHQLTTTPLGFESDSLMIVSVDASRTTTPRASYLDLFQRVTGAAQSTPGVRMAASSVITPMSGSGWNGRVISPKGGDSSPMTFINAVSPGWFETYGMRVLTGRDISTGDVPGGAPVVVVNETFMKRFLGGQAPVGTRIAVGGDDSAPVHEVIGVVNDAVYRDSRRGVPPTIYYPLAQAGPLNASISVTMQVPGGRGNLSPAIRDALRSVDPALSFSIRDYGDQVRATTAQERLVAMLSGFFGGLALLLAGIGLYGVTSYAVTRRTRELAVRMALGADAPSVVRLVLRGVVAVVALGATIGVGLTLWASSFVESLLFGVKARDPLTMVAAILVLALVSLFAGWLPARRASRLDPNVVLRQ